MRRHPLYIGLCAAAVLAAGVPTLAQTPQRLSLDVLAALCDILDCGAQDLIEVQVVNTQVRKKAAASAATVPGSVAPLRTRVRRPDWA